MNIGLPQILISVTLVISGSMGYIVASEANRPPGMGIIMFMGKKGRIFLLILASITIIVFIGSAIYLGITAWVLCAIVVPLTLIILGRLLSPIALRLVVYPLYIVFGWFYRDKDYLLPKNNFTVIAENTTKYYLELREHYDSSINDNIVMLALAGVLDAQNYLFVPEPQIRMREIQIIAELAILHVLEKKIRDKDPNIVNRELRKFDRRYDKYQLGEIGVNRILSDFGENAIDWNSDLKQILLEFMLPLEVEIFMADNPNLSFDSINEACEHESNTIEKAIDSVIREYKVGKGHIAKATTLFMESDKYEYAKEKLKH